MTKTKSNIQYTAIGTDKPVNGQMMYFDGTNWIPVYGWYDLANLGLLNMNPNGVRINGTLRAFTELVDIGTETLRFRDLFLRRDLYVGDRLLVENWAVKEGTDNSLEFWWHNGENYVFRFKLYSELYMLENLYKGIFVYNETPSSKIAINPFTSGDWATRLKAGTTILMGTHIWEHNQLDGWNASTGVWTAPDSGIYEIHFEVHYTRADGTTGWYNAARAGVFRAGLVHNTLEMIYSEAVAVIVAPTRYIALSGTHIGWFDANDTVVLKVMNGSYYNYVSDSADYERMSIRKIK